MTVGQRIRIARKEAGMTQKALGNKMGVTNHCISMWERGLRQPKYETLSRIADAIGINVNRLLQTPMTNADKIRAMSDEELADSFGDGWGWGCELCPEYEQLVKNGLCDGCCGKHCLAWLKQPAREDA